VSGRVRSPCAEALGAVGVFFVQISWPTRLLFALAALVLGWVLRLADSGPGGNRRTYEAVSRAGFSANCPCGPGHGAARSIAACVPEARRAGSPTIGSSSWVHGFNVDSKSAHKTYEDFLDRLRTQAWPTPLERLGTFWGFHWPGDHRFPGRYR